MPIFNGNNSSQTIFGSNADDEIRGFGGIDILQGLAGNDLILGGDDNDTLWGGAGDDDLYGEDGADQLMGGTNNDTLNGGAGNDLLNGGSGIDWADFHGGSGVLVDLFANTATGQGNDTLAQIENIRGSAFSDVLKGNNGANLLEGADGDDRFRLSQGNDVFNGGSGFDMADFSTSQIGLNIWFGSASAGGYSGGTGYLGTLLSIECVIASAYADTISGDGANNTIYAGAGADQIVASPGTDFIDGGAGSDTLSFANLAGVSASLAAGSYLVEGSANGAMVNIENLVGTDYGDGLTGDAGNNTISGGGNADVLHGGAGADQLYGGGGVDRIVADGGDDTLIGNSDAGSAPVDQASDSFVITTLAGAVTIDDFQVGVDTLDLQAFGFDAGGSSSYWSTSSSMTTTDSMLVLTGQLGELVSITLKGVGHNSGFSTQDMLGGSPGLVPAPVGPINGGDGLPTLFALDTSQGFQTIDHFEDGRDLIDMSDLFGTSPNGGWWVVNQTTTLDGSVQWDAYDTNGSVALGAQFSFVIPGLPPVAFGSADWVI